MLKPLNKIIGKFFSSSDADKTVYNPVSKEQLKSYNATRINGPQPVLCYSPFKNIYFGHHGKVVSCCYNRQLVLGVYPEKTIKEIWFGEEAERLRNYILHDDLSLGCHGCANHFKANNFDGIKAKMYDERRANKNKFPSVMEFELSNVCNLECIMCSGEFSSSIRKNREHKPPIPEPYDSAFVNQLEEFIPFLEEVKFYGGEPFLSEIYYEIWDKIIKINPLCRISVQTNATILNNRVKEMLQHANFHINVSLDSLQKETYESIRVNAKFELVMENIEYFHQYTKSKNTFFGISACAMKQNWKELPDFIEFCNKLDIPVYFHSVWSPKKYSLWDLDPNSLKEIHEFVSGFDFPEENAVQKKNKNHYNDTVKLFFQWWKDAEKRESERSPIHIQENIEDAKQVLYKRLVEHVNSMSNLSEEEKTIKLKFYSFKINNIINLLPADFPLKRGFENSSEVRIEMLAAQLEVNTEEEIVQQALAFSSEN